MHRELGLMVAVAALWACGGQTLTLQGDAGGDASSSSSSGSSSSSSGGGSGSSSGGSSSSSGSSSGGSSSSGSSSGGSSSSSGGVVRVPINHRPNDAQCSQPAPTGTCNFGGNPSFMCSRDADCDDAGPNGRCVQGNGGPAYCGCTFDSCFHDSDCTGETCACHGSAYTYGAGNRCVPGNCHVDADCGAGGYCSPTYATTGCGSLGGYYCHTPSDQCIDDSDCNGGTSGPQACAYSTTSGRWQCVQQVLCQ